MSPDSKDSDAAAQQLASMRKETRFEIGLLHDRVNALLAAEAFLTIAYTAAMSNGTPWGATFSRVVSPVLSILGLLLAAAAWPGIDTTVRLVLEWTTRQRQLVDDSPFLADTVRGLAAGGGRRNRADRDQRRSMWFFRAVPVLFVVVWVVLTVVALALPR